MAKKFTSENFEKEVLQADKTVLVDFYADWCGPCKMMAPVVEEMAAEFGGTAIIGKLNTDENMDIATKYNIMSIPTFIVFKNGEAKGTVMGIQNKANLAKMIQDNQ